MTDTTRKAQSPEVWAQTWAATGCADCAGNAESGLPWGMDTCWAQHRPHTGPERNQ